MMKSLLKVMLIAVLGSPALSGEPPLHEAITYENYRDDLGFEVLARVHKNNQDGLIFYTVSLHAPHNELVGVTAVLSRDETVYARFPLRGEEDVLKTGRPLVFGCELSPRNARDTTVVFQLHPNTEEMRIIRIDLGSWPVMFVRTSKDFSYVNLDDVEEALEGPNNQE